MDPLNRRSVPERYDHTASALRADVFFLTCVARACPRAPSHVWAFIEKFKRNRVIVLTTHSMEEADILGDQIAIMALGKLRYGVRGHV